MISEQYPTRHELASKPHPTSAAGGLLKVAGGEGVGPVEELRGGEALQPAGGEGEEVERSVALVAEVFEELLQAVAAPGPVVAAAALKGDGGS